MVILTNTNINIINNCDEILTVKEVSQYLKVNVHKVYELINDGLLPACTKTTLQPPLYVSLILDISCSLISLQLIIIIFLL